LRKQLLLVTEYGKSAVPIGTFGVYYFVFPGINSLWLSQRDGYAAISDVHKWTSMYLASLKNGCLINYLVASYNKNLPNGPAITRIHKEISLKKPYFVTLLNKRHFNSKSDRGIIYDIQKPTPENENSI